MEYRANDVKSKWLDRANNGTRANCHWANGNRVDVVAKDNRIYIRGEFRESLCMNFFSPFQPHVNVHKLYAVEYINTICSLEYPFQFRIF